MSRDLCTLLVYVCGMFGLGSLGGNAVWAMGLIGGKVLRDAMGSEVLCMHGKFLSDGIGESDGAKWND